MLKYLNISNFAIIARVEIEFHAGLNILTGEIGSGKSIIVDALGLLAGGRSSTMQIRSEARFLRWLKAGLMYRKFLRPPAACARRNSWAGRSTAALDAARWLLDNTMLREPLRAPRKKRN